LSKLGIGLWGWAALALLLGSGCSDDSAAPEVGSDASTPGQEGGDGAGGSAGRGASGSGSRAGSGGTLGGGGAGGAAGRAGSSAPGAGRGGAGAGGRAGRAGGGDAGSSGSGGGAGGADNSCSGDGDCVLCTVPLSTEMPCCAGCPTVMSQAQCEAARAAVPGECKARLIPVCPSILCVAPGSPKCEGGMCVMVDGIQQ